MSPLEDLLKKYGPQYHIHADDTQLYLAFSPIDADAQTNSKTKMEHCMDEIRSFLVRNKKKLNDGKTEFLKLRK